MSIITETIYDVLANDGALIALLAEYKSQPAIFTTDPAPGDADMPYIVSAGEVTQTPWDTKTTIGRDLIRDIRCYADPDGSTVTIESIAERVYELFHRQPLVITGYDWILSNCTGPIVADEIDAYGRIISVNIIAQDNGGLS